VSGGHRNAEVPKTNVPGCPGPDYIGRSLFTGAKHRRNTERAPSAPSICSRTLLHFGCLDSARRRQRADTEWRRYRVGVRSRLFFAVVLVVLSWTFADQVAAHTEVFERSPASGRVVGGTIDHIDISFWAAVSASEIRLTDPLGEPVDVEATELLANGRIATTNFAPLTEPGEYVVIHSELASDADSQTARFSFTYDPSSDARAVALFERDTGPNWVLLGGLGGVILILAGLFWPGRSSKSN